MTPIRVFADNAIVSRFKACLLQQRGALLANFSTAIVSTPPNADAPSTSTSALVSSPLSTTPDLVNVEPSAFEALIRPTVMGLLGTVSKAFMCYGNTTWVIGGERLLAAVSDRPANQGLLTVSNHVAAIDDPLVLAAALPMETLMNAQALRWTLCATDRCFNRGHVINSFFRAGKVLPVERGAGLDQVGMKSAEAKLASGDWVHVFPEGTRSLDREVKPAKRGVGRMFFGALKATKESLTPSPLPILLPIVHLGMEGLMPKGTKIPRLGNKISILIGEPIQVQDLLDAHSLGQVSSTELYIQIAERVGTTLQEMHAQLKASHDLIDENTSLETFRSRTAHLEKVVSTNSPCIVDVLEQSTRKSSFLAEHTLCRGFSPTRGFAAGSFLHEAKENTDYKLAGLCMIMKQVFMGRRKSIYSSDFAI
eukprot:CAMPEP_0196579336 /NCGR_PEP_ID=MMETSP1081-20130531/20392_1 /TAXON_ID=36882 /ORGANISM="Pyramimonas amylifera, Strain CCMP720" /LENGTH=422 /DNA_ID=CAMNT_0041898883 /DNA_START=424 /DNA_END=1692 /DNA_ORIENTATION=+